jgi:hypothetical protein
LQADATVAELLTEQRRRLASGAAQKTIRRLHMLATTFKSRLV